MRSFQALLALALASAAQATVNWHQMGVFIEKNFDWTNVDAEIKQAIDHGYNRIYMGFYMSLYGCQGSCSSWVMLPSSEQQDILNYAHANNATIILAVGGPGEFYEGIIDSKNTTCSQFGAQAASFAAANSFDGIDYYVQLEGTGTRQSIYADNGKFANCVATLTNQASSIGWDVTQLSLTAAAPYFSPQFIRNSTSLQQQYSLSWFALDANSDQTFAVHAINEIMINEDNNYMTYQNCFIQNTFDDPFYGAFGLGSAVKEISALGICPCKISIVKSIDPMEESVHSGYIDPTTLGTWGCQANADFVWEGGYVGWTWNGDDTTKTYQWPSLLGTC